MALRASRSSLAEILNPVEVPFRCRSRTVFLGADLERCGNGEREQKEKSDGQSSGSKS